MLPTNDDLLTIARTIGQTMLGADVAPRDPGDSLAGHARYTGCVQIAGEWTGAVVVDCSQDFARQAAASLLGIASDSADEGEVRDTVAELTNIFGGNVKSLLPGPSYISLPSVIAGREFAFQVQGTRLVCGATLEVKGCALDVSLLQDEHMASPGGVRRPI